MWYIAFTLIIVWIIYYLFGKSSRLNESSSDQKENFEPYFSDPYNPIILKNMKDIEGEYPDQLILKDMYPEKANPGYTNESYDTIWHDYPILSATSIETTNYRYWDQPDNGTCVPADLCNGLYEKIKLPAKPEPIRAPNLNDGLRRVNFYELANTNN